MATKAGGDKGIGKIACASEVVRDGPKEKRHNRTFSVKLEFEAFAANVVANDSIEAAFVARKAETVRAGGVKARRPAFYDRFDSLVRLPADSLCRRKPGDSFQRCDHLTLRLR